MTTTLYQSALQDPAAFWAEQATATLAWRKSWDHVLRGSLEAGNVEWFVGAELNASYNCLDRHLVTCAEKTALIWEGNDAYQTAQLTYRQLHAQVCQLANVLLQLGIKPGDRVCIYLPMIPEAIIAMLACARIGAIHMVVFAGFSAQALRLRIQDAQCQIVITATEMSRGHKIIPLKQIVDQALQDVSLVRHVLVIKTTDKVVPWQVGRDLCYQDCVARASSDCPPVYVEAQHPLFILYTSGSTGQPKGILHSTGGYLLYAAVTHRYVFDYRAQDIFWCTADVGWITGHTYGVYGPLANGATLLLFSGVPDYPTPSRYWEIIEKYRVTQFYTAPTALRALRQHGDEWVNKYAMPSLRLLGTVGEPINPDVWTWYAERVGKRRCPIVDTWWQTETGGIMISPLPDTQPVKPGAAALPFFGIEAKIVDEAGHDIGIDKMGWLVITRPWPGMLLTVFNDHQRYIDTYLKPVPGAYFTGDLACRDADGYFWIQGRGDDVLKVSGHRIGTAEIESALLSHNAVSEAAVVGIPDAIKGTGIYAFVTLTAGVIPSDQLKNEVLLAVRAVMGPIAVPQYLQWAEALPKTRSGKIMRRLLRHIANGENDTLGDLTTLANPEIIDTLIQEKIK